MHVPDHIVQSAKQELKDTIHKLSMDLLEKLRDDSKDPWIALCVIQAAQYSLMSLIRERYDPTCPNDDFKISSCEFTQLYSQLIEPGMTDHMMKIALHSVIAHKITKSSEQN
jgi:hypothetical protein